MSNPFIEPGSLLVELERRRRHRFQVGVYAVLGALLCMLMGLLIQGCQTARPKTVTPLEPTPTLSANPTTNATLAAPPKLETNTAPASVAAPDKDARGPSARTSIPGSPATPAASAVPSAPTGNALEHAPAKPAAAETIYVVKAGDSLSRIAKAHGTTVAALKAANGLKSDQIVVGKKLKIPRTKGSTTTSER
ncbi:MAG TPA: LysM peptidoglycan-binding domain-containing protein [Candidatus Sulfotelmatobacter sp.]|nr:LysM peptidoglycan-binding domain-containing protein [Candidatus Sulfotelmatobacter sp.]HWI57065.1 LysM peptidoglycan-binding domain-containing protein [Bacillota bacterium]